MEHWKATTDELLTFSLGQVGHNIYILCHQLAQHNKELAALLKPSELADPKTNQALEYYANHTAQIEVTSCNSCPAKCP